MRHGPISRLAHAADFTAVVEVLRDVRANSPLGPQLCSPDSDTLQEQIAAWCSMPGSSLLVAEMGDDLVGVALVQQVELNLFVDTTYLQVEALFVADGYRRRGVGRALMQLIAHTASEGKATHVLTAPLTGSRSEQRFLSGLGFSPAGTRRIAETPVLLRRLEVLATPRRSRGIDELIARRRRSRGLPPTPARGLALGNSGSAPASHAGR